MKTISIIGSTGSIGTSALEIISFHSDKFKVGALAAGSNIDLLIEQALKFKPAVAAICEDKHYSKLKDALSQTDTIVFSGAEGINRAASYGASQLVLSCIVGAAGLMPTITAIKAGRDIALANKETLVMAGKYINELAKDHGVRLLPVDSEHSAIFQCLANEPEKSIKKLILTASGGPFREKPASQFANISIEEALAHPTWKMGRKISIDSATLMNKGLEVIECHWLFGVEADRIKIVVHPQSVVHSMVEFIDGSILAHLGKTDMKIPIQYAFSFPNRIETPLEPFDICKVSPLEFCEPQMEKFPCLELAYYALEQGGTAPAVLNGANEEAVAAFLNGKIGFTTIPKVISSVMKSIDFTKECGIDEILNADIRSRQKAKEMITTLSK